MLHPLPLYGVILRTCTSGHIFGIIHSLNFCLCILFIWWPVDMDGMFGFLPVLTGGMNMINSCVL